MQFKVKWMCLRCGSAYEHVYKEEEKHEAAKLFVDAHNHPVAETWDIVLYCEKCGEVVGEAQIPTGADGFIYFGDVTFTYEFIHPEESAPAEISETHDTESEGL